jgi:S1-C subfamily serine protease
LTLLVAAAFVVALPNAGAETVLLDFMSTHCPPCREMEPILHELVREGYSVRQVNVDSEPGAARQYAITCTPTFVVLVDGREGARLPRAATRAELAAMIRKATLLAHAGEASSDRRQASISTVGLGMSQERGTAVSTLEAQGGPREGRVVTIQDPFARNAPRAATGPMPLRSPAGQGPSPASTSQPQQAASAEHLIAATVRLSITDPDGRSTGTGVVVDARNGQALVLTCGHLFRASGGEGAIRVERFAAFGGAATPHETVAGELLDFDLDRDLALLRFPVAESVNVAPVAPAGTVLTIGSGATSVGCNHGDAPTPWATRITAINRYQGHANVEAARAPVEGRSGGGLFNAQGQLVGICYAADPQGDEGLYVALASIHEKLNELGFSTVYQTPAPAGVVHAAEAASLAATAPVAASSAPAQVAPSNSQVATGGSQLEVRGQNAMTGADAASLADWPGASRDAASQVSATRAISQDEHAVLQELARRGVGAEVICIIRPEAPGGRSEVIKLNGASPGFVAALAKAAESAGDGAASP